MDAERDEQIRQKRLKARDKLMKMCPPYVVDEGDGKNPPLPMRTKVHDLVNALTELYNSHYSYAWTDIYRDYLKATGLELKKIEGPTPKKSITIVKQLETMGLLPHLYEFIWESYAPQEMKDYHLKKSRKS